MWYDMSGVKMIFFAGVMLAFVGFGIYLMGHVTIGALIMCAGAAAMIISFTILKFHLRVKFKLK